MTLSRDWGVFAGAGMIVAAACLFGVDCYLLGKTRGSGPATAVCPIRGDWRGAVVLVLLAWGAMLLAMGLVAYGGGQLGPS